MIQRLKKKKPRSAKANPVCGIAWYRPEQWQRLREVVTDPEVIEDLHEQWQKKAEKTAHTLRSTGVIPRKVEVDVEALVEWCRKNKRPVDHQARSTYASVLLRKSGSFDI